ncbi:MAG: ribosome biogenesis GTPase Der [Chitinophagaceae bacterium]|nr:ribosome biogenesis GTPase Der [Chitinophagaceae bacterium]
MANIVVIVGRPNVGKSTFFNRLVEKQKAIMDDEPGVTRDRNYGYAEWIGKNFTVVDTGGYIADSVDIFQMSIRKQVLDALEEATVILFLVDCGDGITEYDKDIARVLRTIKKPVFLVANKADNPQRVFVANEFYALGISDTIFPIASASGYGTGELLDAVVLHLQDEDASAPGKEIPRIAILGKPNVGKSSFTNALLGKERVIVTDIAGTTRDSIDSHYTLFQKNFILTDTAGMRRKSKVKNNDVEFFSVLRSIQALQDSDVCIVMVDAQSGLEAQDVSIIHLAAKYKKGILIMVNKWDLILKDQKTADAMRKTFQEKLGTMDYIPIIFASVLQKQRILQTIELAISVHENRIKHINTSQLNEVMGKEIEHYPPPSIKGKHIKIKYITQLPTKTPSFAFFCNHPQYIKESYQRFLSNKIREKFDFTGSPITIFFRQK